MNDSIKTQLETQFRTAYIADSLKKDAINQIHTEHLRQCCRYEAGVIVVLIIVVIVLLVKRRKS